MKRQALTLLIGTALLAGGCVSAISPRAVRSELVRQSGAPPAREFEFDMGRLTTALLKATLGPKPDGTLPLAGLSGIQVAVYTRGGGNSAPLDLSLFDSWGWEDVVRYRDERSSALVTIRGGASVIHDLVLVASGTEQVVYARLRGNLPTTLPQAIETAVRTGGTESVKRQLLDASGEKEH